MIIMLNCSLKGPRGNTRYLMDRLESCAPGPCENVEIRDVLKDIPAFCSRLRGASALVLGAPLYVDAMPAQALHLMEEMYASFRGQFPNLTVYVISNLGFYESSQLRSLFDTARNWCARMQMRFGGGVGMGAGGMMSAFKAIPLGKGPNKALGEALNRLAEAIRSSEVIDPIYVQPTGIPRFAYIISAHRLFRSTGRKNGAIVR